MISESNSNKVTTFHLKRLAYLYIRQSTIRQVLENKESTKRQYQLKEKAIALGWSAEDVVVIDSDLGKSGADSDRAGFQKLVAEVGLGNVGIVLGLEVSRLARNSMDWHRLLEISALSNTLILDEDGIYDPKHFNDRLLLGLKGTMSEAELHIIRARLQGGIINKAKRGELKMRQPIGLIYDIDNKIKLDPDQQIQDSIKLLFNTFDRLGSARGIVKFFKDNNLKFPRKPNSGLNKGNLLWGDLGHSRTLQMLHNPSYAGTFVFGKTKVYKDIEGNYHSKKIDKDSWSIVIHGHHDSYITWDTYESNLKKLRANAQCYGKDRHRSPPKEGPALLQGIVICGKCGNRMTVRYGSLSGIVVPHYTCQKEAIENGNPTCQSIPGSSIDKAIGDILMETVTPINVNITIAIENELKERISEQDSLHQKQVQRAKYEADLARRRFMQVDPDNRLVANSLEAEWNDCIREYQLSRDDYERQSKLNYLTLTQSQIEDIQQLSRNFPKVWNSKSTSNKEKKRLTRLIIEDVTVAKNEKIIMQIRFKGGKSKSLDLPLPKSSNELRQTPPFIVKEIDRLLSHYILSEVVEQLNKMGYRSGCGKEFNYGIVYGISRRYKLKNRYDRLIDDGLLTVDKVASLLDVTVYTVKQWRLNGLLEYKLYNEKGGCLYEPLRDNIPVKHKRKYKIKQQNNEVATNRASEVQYAT
ncbi:MAG: DNA invertase Pin-like site-specific DNA recombinase [Saprospiraceae bacterium]|jgi:DNA invertase Pin-like site-specific DNA recombinase